MEGTLMVLTYPLIYLDGVAGIYSLLYPIAVSLLRSRAESIHW